MNRSENIANIALALVAFNGEVSKIEKDSVNPHFRNRYASLDNIIDEIRPILTKHGLAVIQMPSGDGETLTMSTLLVHTSGEFIESPPLTMRPSKNDPQGIGSTATYARRYSLAAFLSLNTGEDDDGNAGSGPRPKLDNVPLIGTKEEAQAAGQRKLDEQKAKAAYNTQSTPPVMEQKWDNHGGSYQVPVSNDPEQLQKEIFNLLTKKKMSFPELNELASAVLDKKVTFFKNQVKDLEDLIKVKEALT